jgi:branched-chain amino acid aminotransferase
MTSTPIVYFNGQFVPQTEASVSLFDHGLLYGDGVFEGIRAYNGRVFRLDEHLDRLYHSARAILLDIPLSKAEFAEAILETCRQNGLRDAYLRPVVTRGVGDLGIDPRKCKSGATVFIIARAIGGMFGDLYERGLRLVTVSPRRNPPQCVSPNIKSLNYLNNILGKIEANQRGADEGLFLDLNGFVSEATTENFFIVKGETVLTPPTYNSLQGITRSTMLELAAQEGFTVRETPMTLFDVYGADEAFVTGTGAEVVPVVELDGRTFGSGTPGPVTRQLMAAFGHYVRSVGTPIYTEVAVN